MAEPGIVQDNQTQYRGYKLPHAKNVPYYDIARVALALQKVDGDIHALLQGLLGKIGQNELDELEAKLLGGAGPAIDTLKELSALIDANDTDIAAFTTALSRKADKSQLAAQIDAALGHRSWREANTGPRGAKGDRGVAGAKGDKGNKGDKGDTGLRGLTGEKGDRGATGQTGAKGDRGATGPHGSTAGLVQDVRRTTQGWFGPAVWQKQVNGSWVTFYTEPSNYD